MVEPSGTATLLSDMAGALFGAALGGGCSWRDNVGGMRSANLRTVWIEQGHRRSLP
jgi:hypothetical protein